MSVLKTTDVALTPYTPQVANKIIGHINKRASEQATAANLAASTLWIADFDGEIVDAHVQNSVVVGAGESMTFDILKNGVSVLSGIHTLAAATPAKTQTSILSLVTTKGFVKGDVFTTTRAYTAGGTPTPLAHNSIAVEFAPGRAQV